MKLSAVILVVTTAIVFQACAQKEPPKIDCAKQDFSTNHICCKAPMGDLVTEKLVKACKPTKALLKWINSFMGNKLQSYDKNTGINTMNLTTRANHNLLCSVSQFINCVFDLLGIMDLKRTYWNGTNAVKAITITKKDRPEYWKNELAPEVDSEWAVQYATELFNKTISCGPKNKQVDVYIGNMFLVQYLQIHIPISCPETNYTPKNKCEVKIEETYAHCLSYFLDSAHGSQMANLPQIFKDLQEKVYKTPVGMKVKALRASKA